MSHFTAPDDHPKKYRLSIQFGKGTNRDRAVSLIGVYISPLTDFLMGFFVVFLSDVHFLVITFFISQDLTNLIL